MNNKIQIETYMTDIILFDIVGYSLLSDDEQYITIYLMNKKLNEFLQILCGQSFLKTEEVVLGFAPTGDGAFVILNHNLAGYGLFMAIALRTILLQLQSQTNKLFSGLRVAVHFGAAAPLEDLTGKTNYVGSGLNDCARLLSIEKEIIADQLHVKDDNYIIISTKALSLFKENYSGDANKDFLKVIKFEIGDEVEFKDKQKKEHRAFFIESSRHVTITPPKPKDIEKRMSKLIKGHEENKT